MRRARVACAAAAALVIAAAACTLIERPDSYFDPQGTLVTIAAVTGGAEALALTDDAVFFTSDTGRKLHRVLKSGGDTTEIPSDGSEIVAIASDEHTRIGWCTANGNLLTWSDETSQSTTVALAAPCTALAVSHDRMAYAFPIPNGSVFAIAEADGGQEEGIVDALNVRSIAFSTEQVYYVLSAVLLREVLPTDAVDAASGTPACDLSTAAAAVGGSPTKLVVGALDGGPVEVMVFQSSTRAAAQGACCDRKGDGCATVNQGIPSGVGAVAIRGSEAFFVRGAALERLPLAALLAGPPADDAGTTVRAGLPVVDNLAVDDTYAFFTTGDQLQRLALGDGGS